MRADNTHHLRTAVAQRQDATRRRATEALAALQADGQPVTVTGLARAAGVSRSWIYSQPELLAQIHSHQHPPRPTLATTASPASDESWQRRLNLAHARIRELTAEVKQLREQLAKTYGQLRSTGR